MVDTKSKREDELGRWLKPFLDRFRPQGTAADVSALFLGIDWTG